MKQRVHLKQHSVGRNFNSVYNALFFHSLHKLKGHTANKHKPTTLGFNNSRAFVEHKVCEVNKFAIYVTIAGGRESTSTLRDGKGSM